MSCFILSYHVISIVVISCFILSCHVPLSCCVQLYFVMSCYVVLGETGLWQSWFPQQQRPGGRAGHPEETAAPDSWRPLVDVRLQPGLQAAV